MRASPNIFTNTFFRFTVVAFFNLTTKESTSMPHDFQISHDSQALYITLNTLHRLPVFRKDELKTVICNAISEARQSAGLLLFAYVIMMTTFT
jgi:hypothetical protein